MRIVVTGGGSAGHISPILAVADALKRRAEASGTKLELLYIGQYAGVEVDMARQAGIPFAGISAGKYRRIPQASVWQKLSDVRSLALNARDLGRTAAGITRALWLLRRFRPDVVFAKGGFVGLPVAVAARMLGVPVVIHESDVVPGLGNKIVGKWARFVAVGFPLQVYKSGGVSVLPVSRMVFTGNPVRSEIKPLPRDKSLARWGFSGEKPVIMFMGGSQGAEAINNAVLQGLKQLVDQAQIIHVTGQAELRRVKGHAAQMGITDASGYVAEPFINAEDMALALSAADLVVSRAGANTIAELAAMGKPTVLIPNRLMAAHQLVNAARLEKSNAVKVLSDENLDGAKLNRTLTELINDKKVLGSLSSEITKINVKDAPDRIAELILKVGRGER